MLEVVAEVKCAVSDCYHLLEELKAASCLISHALEISQTAFCEASGH